KRQPLRRELHVRHDDRVVRRRAERPADDDDERSEQDRKDRHEVRDRQQSADGDARSPRCAGFSPCLRDVDRRRDGGAHSATPRVALNRRRTMTEATLSSTTNSSSRPASAPATPYLTSSNIVRWISTGSVSTRPPPSSAADVNEPMQLLKIVRKATISPGAQSGRTTR